MSIVRRRGAKQLRRPGAVGTNLNGQRKDGDGRTVKHEKRESQFQRCTYTVEIRALFTVKKRQGNHFKERMAVKSLGVKGA
jgi:hypothetical protein